MCRTAWQVSIGPTYLGGSEFKDALRPRMEGCHGSPTDCYASIGHTDVLLASESLRPQFFFLHFYESLMYIAIVLLLFYFEDRWAYMLGIVAPAAWLLMTFVVGGFGGFIHQMGVMFRGEAPSYPPFFLGGIVSILSVGMIVACSYRWKREFAGLGKGLSTFFISAAIVAAYYGVLAIWFWQSASAALHG